jgi:hypothetical protein
MDKAELGKAIAKSIGYMGRKELINNLISLYDNGKFKEGFPNQWQLIPNALVTAINSVAAKLYPPAPCIIEQLSQLGNRMEMDLEVKQAVDLLFMGTQHVKPEPAMIAAGYLNSVGVQHLDGEFVAPPRRQAQPGFRAFAATVRQRLSRH